MSETTPEETPTVSFAAGQVAQQDLYEVHGYYEDVEDLDGGTVNIERAYPEVRYATELKPGERGNLLVAAGSEVSAEVAAKLS